MKTHSINEIISTIRAGSNIYIDISLLARCKSLFKDYLFFFIVHTIVCKLNTENSIENQMVIIS